MNSYDFYIDTHTHLYSDQFKEDIDEVIGEAQKVGVQKMFLPNIDADSIDGMLNLEKKYPEVCYSMMGLHPCHVKENYKEELSIVSDWLEKRSFVAVGEIGLDLYWDKTFFAAQKEAFITQIEWALKYEIPIVIHSREATNEVIEILESFRGSGLRGIFHCFTGSAKEASAIVDLGMLLGIGGVFTFKKAALEDSLRDIPLSKIVLETDSPYLAPTPFRGKRNQSAYIYNIALSVSEKLGYSIKEVRSQTTKNALELFGVE